MARRDELDEIFSKLDNISVEEIVGSRIALQRKGPSYLGLCPFHADNKVGSFVVTPSKGIWHCFACGKGVGGNGISFVSRYDGIDYVDAALKIAYEHGLISIDEYNTLSDNSFSSEHKKKIERKQAVIGIKKSNYPVAPVAVRHNVYTALKKYAGLSKKDKTMLLNERHISAKRLESDYFTVPTTKKQKEQIIKKIKEDYPNYTDDVLLKVPGFYREKGKDITFMSPKGIGFLCTRFHLINNEPKLMSGSVQIRKEKKNEGQSRYTYLSSSFVQEEPDKYDGGGAKASADLDILIPENPKRILCITEGRFKSEVLASQGNITISVQGVGSWKGIDKQIIDILKEYKIEKIFIFYDSDMLGNTSVFEQAITLAELLRAVFPSIRIYIAAWKSEYGKGIDDMSYLNHQKELSYFQPQTLANVQKEILNVILSDYGVSAVTDIPKEQIEQFKIDLQNRMEMVLFD